MPLPRSPYHPWVCPVRPLCGFSDEGSLMDMQSYKGSLSVRVAGLNNDLPTIF